MDPFCVNLDPDQTAYPRFSGVLPVTKTEDRGILGDPLLHPEFRERGVLTK